MRLFQNKWVMSLIFCRPCDEYIPMYATYIDYGMHWQAK
jgi:hypothetical protein